MKVYQCILGIFVVISHTSVHENREAYFSLDDSDEFSLEPDRYELATNKLIQDDLSDIRQSLNHMQDELSDMVLDQQRHMHNVIDTQSKDYNTKVTEFLSGLEALNFSTPHESYEFLTPFEKEIESACRPGPMFQHLNGKKLGAKVDRSNWVNAKRLIFDCEENKTNGYTTTNYPHTPLSPPLQNSSPRKKEKSPTIESKKLRTTTTPFHKAARRGDLLLVKLFVFANAGIETLDDALWNTPLHEASAGGHEKVVKFLVASNARVHLKNKLGVTSIHKAVTNGHNSTVKLLLYLKANVNTKTGKGLSALHMAAYLRNDSMMKILVNAKADVHAKDFRMETPLQIAVNNGYDSIVAYLISCKAEFSLKKMREVKVYASLIVHKVPVNLRKKNGDYLLDMALLFTKLQDIKNILAPYFTILDEKVFQKLIQSKQWDKLATILEVVRINYFQCCCVRKYKYIEFHN